MTSSRNALIKLNQQRMRTALSSLAEGFLEVRDNFCVFIRLFSLAMAQAGMVHL